MDDSIPPPELLNSSMPLLNQPIPAFLYQLTKMLTNEFTDVIEWKNGQIIVHDPPRMEKEILHKYFRHSKYTSFNRQLNYFGFRKLTGKGRMAPCSYGNDTITNDLQSLLYIKRRTKPSQGNDISVCDDSSRKRKTSPCQEDNVPSIPKIPRIVSPDRSVFSSVSRSSDSSPLSRLESAASENRHEEINPLNDKNEASLLPQDGFMSDIFDEKEKFKQFTQNFLLPSDDFINALNSEDDARSFANFDTSSHGAPQFRTVNASDVKQQKQAEPTFTPCSTTTAVASTQNTPTNENGDNFDAASFCAELNELIRERSSVHSGDHIPTKKECNTHGLSECDILGDSLPCAKEGASVMDKYESHSRVSSPLLQDSPLKENDTFDTSTYPKFISLESLLEPTPLSDIRFDSDLDLSYVKIFG